MLPKKTPALQNVLAAGVQMLSSTTQHCESFRSVFKRSIASDTKAGNYIRTCKFWETST